MVEVIFIVLLFRLDGNMDSLVLTPECSEEINRTTQWYTTIIMWTRGKGVIKVLTDKSFMYRSDPLLVYWVWRTNFQYRPWVVERS